MPFLKKLPLLKYFDSRKQDAGPPHVVVKVAKVLEKIEKNVPLETVAQTAETLAEHGLAAPLNKSVCPRP